MLVLGQQTVFSLCVKEYRENSKRTLEPLRDYGVGADSKGVGLII